MPDPEIRAFGEPAPQRPKHVGPQVPVEQIGEIVNSGPIMWRELLDDFFVVARNRGWTKILVHGHGLYDVPPGHDPRDPTVNPIGAAKAAPHA